MTNFAPRADHRDEEKASRKTFFSSRLLFSSPAIVLMAAALLTPALPAHGLAYAVQASAPPVLSGPVPSSTDAPSILLQPALDNLRQTLGMLHPEAWKASSAEHEGINANLGSIRKDLDSTLPALLLSADTPPPSVTRVLPVLRNVDALYDVLLRVTEGSKAHAPRPQSEALTQAMSRLEEARRSLGDQIQALALLQEQQITHLQTALAARPSVSAPTPATTDSAQPQATHPKPKKKPKTSAPAKPGPAPTTSPQK